MVGLSELPLELKKIIVEWATQMDISCYSRVPLPGNVKRGFIFANGNAPRGSCLRAISQVDRTFFALCRPVLWKVLDLRKLRTPVLSGFHGSEILQRKYLRAFTQVIKTKVMIFRQPFRELTAAETKQPAELERFLHIERILCQEINPLLINTLELELVLVGELFDGYIPTCAHPLTARLLLNLSSLKNVQSFNVVSPVSPSLPEDLLVQTVSNMKLLASFAADNIGHEERTPTTSTENLRNAPSWQAEGADDQPPQKPQTRTLAEVLSNLKFLRSLRMYDCLCVDQLWGEISWQSPLTEIVLRRCPNLSSLALQRFTRKFHDSLGRMEVCTIGISESEQIQTDSPGYLWEIIQRENLVSFKNLRALKLVGINMGEHLFKSFQNSPRLSRLEIDSPNIRAQTLFKLIRKSPRLSAVDCRVRGGTGSLDVIMYCFTHGILLDEAFY